MIKTWSSEPIQLHKVEIENFDENRCTLECSVFICRLPVCRFLLYDFCVLVYDFVFHLFAKQNTYVWFYFIFFSFSFRFFFYTFITPSSSAFAYGEVLIMVSRANLLIQLSPRMIEINTNTIHEQQQKKTHRKWNEVMLKGKYRMIQHLKCVTVLSGVRRDSTIS